MRTFAILYLVDGVILTTKDNALVTHFGMSDVIHQRPANASSLSSINETILRTRVKGIFSINELGMKHDVTLLAECREVLQSLPMNKILGACNTGLGSSCRGVERLCLVMALYTKNAIYPTILMLCYTHVIDVGGWRVVTVRHGDRFIPEAPLVDAVG